MATPRTREGCSGELSSLRRGDKQLEPIRECDEDRTRRSYTGSAKVARGNGERLGFRASASNKSITYTTTWESFDLSNDGYNLNIHPE